MSTEEQCAVLRHGMDCGLFTTADVIRWADAAIASLDKPPFWLIELATGRLDQPEYARQILLEQSTGSLTARQRIQIILAAYRRGKLDLDSTLAKLFPAAVFDPSEHPTYATKRTLDERDNRLCDLLVIWDQLDFKVSPELNGRLESVFAEYLRDSAWLAAIVKSADRATPR